MAELKNLHTLHWQGLTLYGSQGTGSRGTMQAGNHCPTELIQVQEAHQHFLRALSSVLVKHLSEK